MNKEHLFSITKKDFEINYFSGKGAGGQHRNKHQNCVRLKHKNSNVISTGQSHKERKSNLKEAFNNLFNNPKFQLWFKRKSFEVIENKTIEKKVEEAMCEENIKIEIKENGKWKDEKF